MDCKLDRSLLHISRAATWSQSAAHLLYHPTDPWHDHGEDMSIQKCCSTSAYIRKDILGFFLEGPWFCFLICLLPIVSCLLCFTQIQTDAEQTCCQRTQYVGCWGKLGLHLDCFTWKRWNYPCSHVSAKMTEYGGGVSFPSQHHKIRSQYWLSIWGGTLINSICYKTRQSHIVFLSLFWP